MFYSKIAYISEQNEDLPFLKWAIHFIIMIIIIIDKTFTNTLTKDRNYDNTLYLIQNVV